MAERTKEFVENIKIRQVPTGYQMILLDDESRSTNVLLDRTIEMILERNYKRKWQCLLQEKNWIRCWWNVQMVSFYVWRKHFRA